MRHAFLAVLLLQALYPQPWAAPVNHDSHKRSTPDNGFTFCRLLFSSDRSELGGMGWSTDYPRAGRNFMTRLSELTTIHIDTQGAHPRTWVVPASSPSLHTCPFLMASDVGTARFSPEEVQNLQHYFHKGGFLWVDDFWAIKAWDQWTEELRQIVPTYQIQPIPLSHPLFRILHHIQEVPQVSHMDFWIGAGHTKERGSDSPRAELWGAFDENNHLSVLMTYNTDIGDTWEREADNMRYFELFSPDGYALGVNILLYVMAH